MRIAIAGCQNSGKSTLVNNILGVWTNYTTPKKTYRDLIKEKNLPHSSGTTPETQWEILNFMVDQLQATTKTDKIVFDRCPIDNLVYSLHAFDRGVDGFTQEYIDKCIAISRESLRNLDIIFLLRYSPQIAIEEDGVRDTNVEYIKEIDELFEAMNIQYKLNYEAGIFFPKDDSPVVIELPMSIESRVDTIAQYINTDGELYSEEDSIFSPDKIDALEALVKQQKTALDEEEKTKELYKKFGIQK